MNIKKYIGLLILLLMLAVSSCQKPSIVTDNELFSEGEVSNKITLGTVDDTESINDDEDEDNDPDGDEEEVKKITAPE